MSEPPSNPRWHSIPLNKRIRIVEDTPEFVVIDKPPNLRSVPGHASSPQEEEATSGTNKSNGKNRKTAHEAWILALQSFERETGGDPSIASQFLQRLSNLPNLKTIPRKEPLFRRFMERSQKRFHLPMEAQEREALITQMYDMLVARQRPLMNLPTPTALEESAMGQLELYFQQNPDSDKKETQIRAVHRLDCQVRDHPLCQ